MTIEEVISKNTLEAINIILQKRLDQLQFDKTIDATIIDDSKAKDGIYTVSTGNTTFLAYSTETGYEKKDVVMITIPQGDYSKQKIIIGKQTDKDNKSPLVYNSPFSQLINLTGNLVQNPEEKIVELLANGEEKSKKFYDNGNDNYNILNLKNNETIPLSQYNRLGLKISFSTWLNEYNLIAGNYGIIIYLHLTAGEEDNNFIYSLTFDSKDFFGDIYNFENYYTQEAIFDLSRFENYYLKEITLEAYQLDNFKTDKGNRLKYDDASFTFTKNNNIFVKNPYICLGNSKENFDKDTLKIILKSGGVTYKQGQDNKKELSLQWIHKDDYENIILNIFEEDIPNGYNITWYRYKVGAPSTTILGPHWVQFYGQYKENNEIKEYDNQNNHVINKLTIDFYPNIQKQTESLCAIIEKIEDNTIIKSQIITFNNEDELAIEATKISMNALGIKFEDDEKGHYFLYDKTRKIINNEKAHELRTLQAVFNLDINNIYNKDNLSLPYKNLKWIFPMSDSMIIPYYNDTTRVSDLFSNENDIEYLNETYKITKDNKNNNYIIELQDENDISTFCYKIANKLNYNNIRNTVYLQVEKDGQLYTTSVFMEFNTFGSSGSEYNIFVDWNNNKPVFDVYDGNLSGQVYLQDKNGNDIELNEDAQYSYNWYKQENNNLQLEIVPNEADSSFFTIQKSENCILTTLMNELYILEIVLENFGDYKLTAYFPISLIYHEKENNGEYDKIFVKNIEGPTIIRYGSDGIIDFDNQNCYVINFSRLKNNGEVEDIDSKNSKMGYWKIISNDNELGYKNISLPTLAIIDSKDSLSTMIQEFDDIIREIFDSIIDNKEYHDFSTIKYITENPNLPEENLSDEQQKQQLSYDFYTNIIKDNQSLLDSVNEQFSIFYETNGEKHFFIDNFLYFLEQHSNYFYYFIHLFIKNYSNYFKNFFQSFQGLSSLSFPKVYFENTPLCGIQYILNTDVDEEIVLYTQPLYIYRDEYPSTTLNNWNGKELVIDDENGSILAHNFSAGKKDDNNKFTGVILGDWSQTNSDLNMTTNTGIYGFHQGAMSYAFKDDGTAFIGKDGQGRIEFNTEKNQAIIQSGTFNEASQTGTQLNLSKGSLLLFGENNSENYENYSIVLNSNPDNYLSTILKVGRIINAEQYSEVISDEFFKRNYEDSIKNLQNYQSECLNQINNLLNFYNAFHNNNNDNNNFTDIFLCTSEDNHPAWDDFISDENYIKYSIPSLLLELQAISINKDSEGKYYYNNIFKKEINNEIINIDIEDLHSLLRENDGNLKYNNNNIIREYFSSFCDNESKIITSTDFPSNSKSIYDDCEISCIKSDSTENIINSYLDFLYNKSFNSTQINQLKNKYELESEDFSRKKLSAENFDEPTPDNSSYILKYKYLGENYYHRVTSSDENVHPSFEEFRIVPKKPIKEFCVYVKERYTNKEVLQFFKTNLKGKLWTQTYIPITICTYLSNLNSPDRYEEFKKIECEKEIKSTSPNNSSYIKIYTDTNKIKGLYKIKQYLVKKYLEPVSTLKLTNDSSDIVIINQNLISYIDKVNEAVENIESQLNLEFYNNNNFSNYLQTIKYKYNYSYNYYLKEKNSPKDEEDEEGEENNFNDTSLNEQTKEIKLFKTNNNEEDYSYDELLSYFIIRSIFQFNLANWENDLINLNKNNGYITSVNYRPTITLEDIDNENIRSPLQDQKIYYGEQAQGMKGFIIDLTNDRIVLGNNSSILGYQTQHYNLNNGSNNQMFNYRTFSISTGANFYDRNGLGQELLKDNGYFIKAENNFQDIFYVKWNGTGYIKNLGAENELISNIYCKNIRITNYIVDKNGYKIFSQSSTTSLGNSDHYIDYLFADKIKTQYLEARRYSEIFLSSHLVKNNNAGTINLGSSGTPFDNIYCNNIRINNGIYYGKIFSPQTITVQLYPTGSQEILAFI